MLKYYINSTEALKRLRADRDGVVSFEYLIVAACIIAVVSLTFGNPGPLQGAITAAINAISAALTTAVTTG
jgi:pilus assembly protein Flp/PilA